jgi:hypothetical protein
VAWQRLEQLAGARNFEHAVGRLRLARCERGGFVRRPEMRREHLDGLDGSTPVGDGDDVVGIELMPLGPSTPGVLDARRRVHENAVEVEQDGRARE